jgi:predicted DNA-binding WGR domain protein
MIMFNDSNVTFCHPLTPYQLTLWRAARWETTTRYYEAHVQQDLWGSWMVIRLWGGKASRRRGAKIDHFTSQEAAYAILDRITKRRLAHGYEKSVISQDDLSKPASMALS